MAATRRRPRRAVLGSDAVPLCSAPANLTRMLGSRAGANEVPQAFGGSLCQP